MQSTDAHGAVPDWADAVDAAGIGVGETPAAPLLSAGQLLRLSRQAAGLSAADVAQSLKFSARQVEALEADDHAVLPGTTVVRGFARSYAKLLGLNVDEVLALLDARAPNLPVEVRPPENMGIASAPGGLRQIPPLASAAIVIGLAAAFIALWQFFSPAPSGSAQPVVTTSVAAPAMVVPQTPASFTPPADQSAARTAPVQPQGPTLSFVFDERAWLELKDATGQILHTGENPGGTRITLAGSPPFDIVIGNATKVRLRYDDHDIDLAPYTRAEVARLKLE